MYLFYLIDRIVDHEAGISLLPEIHRRVSGSRQLDWSSALARIDRPLESILARGHLSAQ